MLKFVITDAFKITLLYAPLTPNPPQREPKSNSIVFFFSLFLSFCNDSRNDSPRASI
jgi:hypothetical protein